MIHMDPHGYLGKELSRQGEQNLIYSRNREKAMGLQTS